MTSTVVVGLLGRNPRKSIKGNGGRYRIRTYDFHRVNFEVVNLKPFACFAFPL